MGHVLHLAPIIETEQFYCQTQIDEDTICEFRWTLDVPAAGKITHRLACPRCGHAYQVTVQRTPKPTRAPKPRKPKPAPVCYHDRGWGYVDPHGRHRCSACGEILGKARAPHGTA